MLVGIHPAAKSCCLIQKRPFHIPLFRRYPLELAGLALYLFTSLQSTEAGDWREVRGENHCPGQGMLLFHYSHKSKWENSKGNTCRDWRCHQRRRESSQCLGGVNINSIFADVPWVYLSRGKGKGERWQAERLCLHSDFCLISMSKVKMP